jgi:hypothetical protein
MEKEAYIHPRYTVTEEGDVYTVLNGTRIKLSVNYRKAYPIVNITLNNKRKGYVVHRIVAIAFIPNPENKPEVNHIDGDKRNFHVSNLEWATRKENAEHAKRTGLYKNHGNWRSGVTHPSIKTIVQYSRSGEYLAEYISQKEASRITGVGTSSISSVLTNRKPTGGGYIWKFKDQENTDLYTSRIKNKICV